ncbi:MAG: gliding motility-associated C-terminal domain-containing protein [Bacteroidia bacterium]|nr:gliding motility-associated C-terminal domain-containing protein [Bacteroidia bacterium]
MSFKFYLLLIGFIITFNTKGQISNPTSPHIYIKFSKKDYDCTKGAVALSIDSGKPPYTITWSNGVQGYYYLNELEPADYSVLITDGNGKDTTLYFSILKTVCRVIPDNLFSPNGDNINDRWRISGLEYYKNFELFVFNKWGQQVHHQEGGTYEPWDGRYLGTPVVDATYYFVLYLEKGKKDSIIKGNVTIIR